MPPIYSSSLSGVTDMCSRCKRFEHCTITESEFSFIFSDGDDNSECFAFEYVGDYAFLNGGVE